MLIISKDLKLPKDAVTQTFAIMAKRGVGKTHTASVMAEEMLKQNQPVVIYDPTSAWWGLKSSADGKKSGFPVVIFGGEHADVPLEENAGELIATVIVERRISAILDCGLMRKGARIRFMTAFCETLYHKNREPIHFFIDEAQTVAPQNLKAMPEIARLVGALEDIILQGRRRGLGVTVISPRPAIVNTSIRSACEVLIAMQIVGPHDRKAIQEWIDVHGDDTDRAKEMMASLSSLKRGEAWVWSPAWLELFTRTKFRQRETFDSSATPEVGHRITTPKKMADIDLAKLGDEIAATVERVKSDDPKALRAKIAQLERELAMRKTETKTVEVPAVSKKDMAGIREAVKEMDKALAKITAVHEAWRHNLAEIGGRLDGLRAAMLRVSSDPVINWPAKFATGGNHPAVQPSLANKFPTSAKAATGPLRSGANRILRELAARHPAGYTRAQVATLTGFSPRGGTFNTYLSDLRRAGFIEENDGAMRATESGMQSLGGDIPAAPVDRAAVMAMWKNALRAGAYRMLEAVADCGDMGTDRPTLATVVGMEVSGGTFNTYLSDLRRNGLIEESGGIITASDTLV